MYLDCSHYLLIFTIFTSKGGYAFLFTICFFSAITSFMCSNFAVSGVLEHSNVNTPLLYQISATWSNHEGSLLLWCWLLSFLGLGLAGHKNVLVWTKSAMARVQGGVWVLGFFALFFLTTSNSFLKNQILCFHSIAELNPVLQDPVLAIHPPCIYIGYVASAICFSLCFNVNKSVLGWSYLWSNLRVWVSICWSSLTIGILLGSWWAYHELGWGGWWFWDPVENASLMPWLLATAGIHSLVVSRLNKLSLFINLLTFILSVLGTFFVRSGLLASVHSFAIDSTRGLYLFSFFIFILIISVVQYYYSSKANNRSRVRILHGSYLAKRAPRA